MTRSFLLDGDDHLVLDFDTSSLPLEFAAPISSPSNLSSSRLAILVLRFNITQNSSTSHNGNHTSERPPCP